MGTACSLTQQIMAENSSTNRCMAAEGLLSVGKKSTQNVFRLISRFINQYQNTQINHPKKEFDPIFCCLQIKIIMALKLTNPMMPCNLPFQHFSPRLLLLATLLFASLTLSKQVFLADATQQCDTTCMNYCATYYPTVSCLASCHCAETDLGRVLYNDKQLSLLAKVGTLATATPTPAEDGTTTPSADLSQCIATCNGKCETEKADKKDACVNMCVNMCKASYDIEVGQKKPTTNTTSTNKTNSTVTPIPTPVPPVEKPVDNSTIANVTNGTNSSVVTTPEVPPTNTPAQEDALLKAKLAITSSPLVLLSVDSDNTAVCNPNCISKCGLLTHTPSTSNDISSCFSNSCNCELPELGLSKLSPYPAAVNFYTSYLRAEQRARFDPEYMLRTNITEELELAQRNSEILQAGQAKLIQMLEISQEKGTNPMPYAFGIVGVLIGLAIFLTKSEKKAVSEDHYISSSKYMKLSATPKHQ